jgi:hypothetical protein
MARLGEGVTMTNTIISTSYSSLTLPDGRPLTLPSGAQCDNLDRFDLARALVGLGVAGVNVSTGLADSLRLYSAHVETMKAQPARAYNSGDEFIKAVVADQEVKAV